MSRVVLLSSLALLLRAPGHQFCDKYKISKNPNPLQISKVIRNGFEKCLPMSAQIRFKVDHTYYQQFFRTWCHSLSSCYQENGNRMQQQSWSTHRNMTKHDDGAHLTLSDWSYQIVASAASELKAKKCCVDKIAIEMLKFNMSSSDIIKVGRVLACAMEPMDTLDVAMFSLRYVYKTTG